MLDVSSPRRRDGSPRRRYGSPRRRGPPRRGHAPIGEPKERKKGPSGSPRRGVACLGEPLRLGEGKLCLSELATVRGLCLRPVWGQSRGLVCDCCGFLRGSLCNLFECVIA